MQSLTSLQFPLCCYDLIKINVAPSKDDSALGSCGERKRGLGAAVGARGRAGRRPRSVHVGQHAVGHAPAVLVPGQAVLPPALALVAGFPVDQQHGEVDHVEIGQNVVEACGEGQWAEVGALVAPPRGRTFVLLFAQTLYVHFVFKHTDNGEAVGETRPTGVWPRQLSDDPLVRGALINPFWQSPRTAVLRVKANVPIPPPRGTQRPPTTAGWATRSPSKASANWTAFST